MIGAADDNRRPLSVAIRGGNEEQRSVLKDLLTHIRELRLRLTESAVAPRKKESNTPDVEMVILDGLSVEHWREQLRFGECGDDGPILIALLIEHSPEHWRAAFRAGADDALAWPPKVDDALRCLLRAAEHQSTVGVPARLICSLVSVSGGVGVSSLAVNLGGAFLRSSAKRVALVDLNLQTASLSTLLDIEPEHDIIELTDPTSSIDSIRLEPILCKHPSGLHLLAAPQKIEQAEMVTASSVGAIVELMSHLFDVLLVDCGHHLNESLVVIWEQSDYLLYVVDQSVTSIRAAQRFLDLIKRLNLQNLELRLVLNRYSPRHPITVEQIESALKQPVWSRIVRDDQAFVDMQVSGESIWKVTSGAVIRGNMEALAKKLMGVQAEQSTSMGKAFIGRLLATTRLKKNL